MQKIRVFAKSDVGKVRQTNEDNFLVGNFASFDAQQLSSIQEFKDCQQGLVLMVSDGMGGAAAGEIASALAVQTLEREMRFTGVPTRDQFVERLRTSLHEANRVIADYAEAHPHTYGMGATATAAGILQNEVIIGQVGDSRAYLIRENTIEQLTRDQSYVNQLVEAGKITEEEAEIHPRRNIILQALGNQNDLDVVISQCTLQPGDRLLLCSDGLTSMVKKEEIHAVVMSLNIQKACQTLVDLANLNGGHDNITVVLAEFL